MSQDVLSPVSIALTPAQVLARWDVGANLATANINNPTELNAVGTTAGDFRIVATSGGSPDSTTLYRLDTTSAAVAAPYVMASATAGLRWVAVAGYATAGAEIMSGSLTVNGGAIACTSAAGSTAFTLSCATANGNNINFVVNSVSISQITMNAGQGFVVRDLVNSYNPIQYNNGSSSAGVVYFNATTPSTSSSSGCIVASGGLGVAGAIFTGGNISAGGNIIASGGVTSNGGSLVVSTGAGNTGFSMFCPTGSGNFVYSNINSVNISQLGFTLSNPFYLRDAVNSYNPIQYNTGTVSTGSVAFAGTTVCSSTVTGAVTMAGGLGVAGAIYSASHTTTGAITAGGNINANSGTVNLTSGAGSTAIAMSCATGNGNNINFVVNGVSISQLTMNAGQGFVVRDQVNSYNPIQYNNGAISAGVVYFNATTASTSTGSGAVQISGGLGVAGNIYGGGVINAATGHSVAGTQIIGAQQTGYGTPTNGGIISSFNGSTATAAQTTQMVAQILIMMKTHGIIGA